MAESAPGVCECGAEEEEDDDTQRQKRQRDGVAVNVMMFEAIGGTPER